MARNKPPKAVLVTRFSALGDVVMTIPALYDACMANPGVEFVMLTRASIAPLFINRPVNLTIEGVDLKEWSGPLGLWRLVKEMKRRHGIEMIVDLHDVLRTKIIRLAGRLLSIPSVHIDKGRSDKRRLTRSTGKVLLPLKHSIERYRDTFAQAGLPSTPRFDGLFATHPATPADYAAITPPRPAGEVWVGIAPFARHQGKIYPPELMEQVIRELSGRTGWHIFLFGGGETEKTILAEWARKYPSTTSLAGQQYGFPAELALLSQLDVMISMDSANMHLAAIAGTPVVALWGATHPYCGFSGWRVPEENNIQLPIPCRPCSVFGNRPCALGGYRCLSGIRPRAVTDRVDTILAR